jgi:hypothetical protein
MSAITRGRFRIETVLFDLLSRIKSCEKIYSERNQSNRSVVKSKRGPQASTCHRADCMDHTQLIRLDLKYRRTRLQMIDDNKNAVLTSRAV